MLIPIALVILSIAALAYAVRVALSMVADRAAARDRIERAVRPAHGRAIQWEAPSRYTDKPGSN